MTTPVAGVWEQVIAEVDPPARRRRRDRVRNWLRRRAIVVPVIALVGGAAFGAQPAWCACSHDRGVPALSSPSVAAAPALATADPTAPPPELGRQPLRATR